MNHVNLGNTGTKICPIILGTMQFGWRIDEEESFRIMDKALEVGINCFDTADIYTKWAENSYAGKTEKIIGKWMKDRGTRNDLVLATKLYGPMSDDINDKGLSRRHIYQAISGSLKRLKTDWIDLYQIHTTDASTPMEETLHGLNLQIEEGLINYIGASNINAWQLMESLWLSEKYGYLRFETIQPPYSIARRMIVEEGLVSVARKYNIGIIPYSPLGGGFLTGMYKKDGELPDTPRMKSVQQKYFSEKRWKILETVKEVGLRNDASPAQVAIAWVLNKEFITAPIIGANSIEQLEENFGALSVNLASDDIKLLDEASSWNSDLDLIR